MGSDNETEKATKEKKKLIFLAPIAKPLAGKKLCRRTYKLVRRVFCVHVPKGIGKTCSSCLCDGLCVIAGNISPIDVITHVPILCEESDIPYIYVPSKEDLATAAATKRPTCCMLVLTKPVKGELDQEVQEKLRTEYDQVVSEVKELESSLY
ncbi:H/ACA ribonucleoprotein complex subunit 2-like protein [Platanthera guangdongensis]|uniref:H/ACA ribonucleoprotein complex subunit 2-like protein n=1 Tax=Platanthera guangdongensis TaxID=2320717 RepID=A0ABR2LU29_9ASPA